MINKHFEVYENNNKLNTLDSKQFINTTITMIKDYKEKVFGSKNRDETLKDYNDILATLEKGVSENSIETALKFYKKYAPLVEIKIID